ncbi:hypothetical protein [Sphingobacterium sp.]|uniref:hypothetical protein n=1 Tax=Sphingobacterium sp. TaxID=341027 RepID=UPI0028A58829|nr:hypothetical protein [Sphingobacterium sp.]
MRRLFFKILVTIYVFALILFCQESYGQYGLEFSSHEKELDKRTSLSIGTEESIELAKHTELTFDIQFKPYQQDYFGYIFRLILDEQLNIDLIYDRRQDNGRHFKLVVGDKFTDINFDIPKNDLFYHWTKIKILLDKEKGSLVLSTAKNTFTHKMDLKDRSALKLLFGFNDYKFFQSSDLPPMRIKDVQISCDEKLCHHWKLDEITGNTARDDQGSLKAFTKNPSWIKRQRQEWRLENEFYVSGQASVAFDHKNENVYIVSEDSLVRTNLGATVSTSWPYLNGPLYMVNGSQSLFDPSSGKVLNISIDQKLVSAFDTLTRTWSQSFQHPAHGTHYLSFNKFYSAKDSSIYMVAGYGHFRYKSAIHKYHIPSNSWDSLSYAGDPLFPHYLGAMGVDKDAVYLLGGYGSTTGDQMLNPKISNDFVLMDINSKTFKTLGEIKFPIPEAVWANSLVMDEASNTMYGLMFPRNKFKSFLQLVAMSKDGKNLEELGSTIPFDFHDIKSFADFFYSKASNRFVAVTLFYDSALSQSRVRIYSLLAPALPYQILEGSAKAKSNNWIWISGLVILAGLGLLFWLKRTNRKTPEPQNNPTVERKENEVSPVLAPILKETAPKNSKIDRATINLFRGDIQIFDQQGDEITKQFSPLLKELLTMFVVYTIYRGRGVSSEKLMEIFWSDKSTSSATNNRSVNIAKINALLEQLGEMKISKKSGYWSIESIEDVHIDFSDFMYLFNKSENLDRQEIDRLLKILEKGGFMFDTDYEWLDGIKDEVSIHATGLLSSLMKNLDFEKDSETIIEIANRIFHFDSVHEEAMVYKCRALVQRGYHSLAHQCFENFSQVYQQLYDESYNRTYREIV